MKHNKAVGFQWDFLHQVLNFIILFFVVLLILNQRRQNVAAGSFLWKALPLCEGKLLWILNDRMLCVFSQNLGSIGGKT